MQLSLPRTAAGDEADLRESGQSSCESGPRRRESETNATRSSLGIDDRWARGLGVPGFGLIIPRVTPLLDGLSPTHGAYWLGTVYFIGLAAAIWHGNRWLLFEQRRHYGWFDHPLRKLCFLLGAVVLYTAPLTIAALSAWYGAIGQIANIDAIRTVTLMNVICVIFVTHAYETVFLIKEREGDLLRVAKLDKARAEAELSAFLAQVDPHFLFNSLNTLGHLIDTDVARANKFTHDLASVYRYVLRQRGRSLVPLCEELEFANAYLDLAKIRYGDAIRWSIQIVGGTDLDTTCIPPTALQLLLENAIKHNQVGIDRPLDIRIELTPTRASVANRRQARRQARPSAGIGLHNLDERSRLVAGAGIDIEESGSTFIVHVPLVANPT